MGLDADDIDTDAGLQAAFDENVVGRDTSKSFNNKSCTRIDQPDSFKHGADQLDPTQFLAIGG